MNTTKKPTLETRYNELIELAKANGKTELVEFCEERIALIHKKKESKSLTPTQVENEKIKAVLLEIAVKPLTITDMLKSSVLKGKYADLSNQKISSLANQLVNEHLMTKVQEKGRSYFQTANVED